MRWISYKESSLTTGNNDFYVTVGKNATIKQIDIFIQAPLGDVSCEVFDDEVTGGPGFAETYYNSGRSIKVNYMLQNSDGKLGVRISGLTETDSDAYLNIGYEL